MKEKNKRKLWILVGAVVFAAALYGGWYFLYGKPAEANQEEESIAVPVEVLEVQNGPVQTFLQLTGRLQPLDRIDIYSEVSGIMEDAGKPFKTGIFYKKGELLIQINNDEAQQNLLAQRSGFISLLANTVADLKVDFPDIYDSWANYLASIKPDQPLKELPEVQNRRQKLFLTGRNLYGQYHMIKQMEERLTKYRIYAPFSGTLTETMIDRGALVMQGQPLGEFVRTDLYELVAAVNLEDRPLIEIGDQVQLRTVNTDSVFTGTIDRINEKVDPQLQSIEVFIRVSGKSLTTGMYLEGQVVSHEFEQALRIPRNILLQDQRVFIVQDSTAKIQKIELLHSTADEAVIRGLKEGTYLILEQRNEAFEGSRVSPVKEDKV